MSKPLEELGLPLYPYLSILYQHAPFAVDLFFLLSGFIFFWFYADKIATRKTSFHHFMSYRLTRLYPVHIITLLSLVLLQSVMFQLNNHTFIIQHNDTYHFILNFFLIHSWGFEKTPALNGFNGPSWSVSVELLLYLLFFLVSWKGLHQKKWFVISIIIMGAVIQYFYSMIGQGIYSFFLGGLTYHLYAWLEKQQQPRQVANKVTALAALLWMIILTAYAYPYIRNASLFLLQKALPGQSEAFDISFYNLARNTFFRTIISPVTVLALALSETVRGSLKVKWTLVLGNASYAIYLLHFPLMVFAVVFCDYFGISRSVFHSPFTLLLFYAVLIPLSIFIHYYFEVIVQDALRRRLLKKPVPSLIPAANKQIIT